MSIEELIMLYKIRVQPLDSIVWARIGNHEVGAKYSDHASQSDALRYAVGAVMVKAAQHDRPIYPSVKAVEDFAAQAGVKYARARKALVDASGDLAIAFDLVRVAR